MNFRIKRTELPQAVFPVLPFLLFLPTGFRTVGGLVFLLAVAASGNYAEKWSNIRHSPLFLPVAAMLGLSILAGLFLDSSAKKFWGGFAHYQSYIFLLLFICIGAGPWQRRAGWSFVAGALVAATLFYLKALGWLPSGYLFDDLFQHYRHYSGNASIVLGVLLALAAGVFLYETLEEGNLPAKLRSLVAFLYVTPALLLYSMTRTGALLFFLVCGVAVLHATAHSWRKAAVVFTLLAAVLAASWHYSPSLQARVAHTVDLLRAVTSEEQARPYDARLELYEITTQIISEKPITGHGIAQWMPLYKERAKGLVTEHMATPHNEYMLYTAELGVAGVVILIWTWLVQLIVAARINGRTGMHLGMLTIAMIVGAMFNAILRDAVFALAFMILLAIPLAGVRSPVRATLNEAGEPVEKRAAA